MYETAQQARGAVNKLKEEQFSEDSIIVITPGGRGADAISAALKAGKMLGDKAELYSEGVQAGHAVVLVYAPFGHGQEATEILNSFNPMELEPAPAGAAEESSFAWDEAAPLSSAFQLRVLLRKSPAPFSSWVGFHTLAEGRTFGSRKELTASDWTFSSLFGLGVLSKNQRGPSSSLGLRTLSSTQSPGRSRFGLPLLSSNPAPLSSRLRLNVLKPKRAGDDPSPFSDHFGLPTLTRRQTSPRFGKLASTHFALFGRNPLSKKAAPLSGMFGLKVLQEGGRPSRLASFGMPLLTAKGAPTLGGLPTLSSNPAPFSSMLGLPVLSMYQ
jgi:hypothetical protein